VKVVNNYENDIVGVKVLFEISILETLLQIRAKRASIELRANVPLPIVIWMNITEKINVFVWRGGVRHKHTPLQISICRHYL